MDADLTLVAGLAGLAATLPAAISAMADGRRPWAAVALAVGGAGFVAASWWQRGGALTWGDVPEAVYGVIGRVF